MIVNNLLSQKHIATKQVLALISSA